MGDEVGHSIWGHVRGLVDEVVAYAKSLLSADMNGFLFIDGLTSFFEELADASCQRCLRRCEVVELMRDRDSKAALYDRIHNDVCHEKRPGETKRQRGGAKIL